MKTKKTKPPGKKRGRKSAAEKAALAAQAQASSEKPPVEGADTLQDKLTENQITQGEGTGTVTETEQPEERETNAPIELSIRVRHNYTDVEMLAFGKNLALERQRRGVFEGELERIKDQYKSKFKETDAKIDEFSDKLNSGYEMVEVKSVVLHNRKHGLKFFYHAGTGAFLHKEAMQEPDYQEMSPPWPDDHKEGDAYPYPLKK